MPLFNHLKDLGCDCTIQFYRQFYKKNWIDKNIKELADGIDYKVVSSLGIYRELRNNYDCLVFGVIGTRLIPKLSKFIKNKNIKTKIVSGYVGALLNNNDQSFIKGVRRRAFSDLIWTPGVDAVQSIIETGLIDKSNVKVEPTGLPRFDELYSKISSWEKDVEKKLILYLEQPTFPESEEDRRGVIEKLFEIANAYPNKTVVLKPRFSLKTGHAHRPKYLMQEMIDFEKCPKNFKVMYDDIYSLFEKTYMALTISSTAGLESLLAGIPTYFISDFCNNENKYGSDYFSKTGAVTTFDAICSKKLPKIKYESVQEIMRFDGRNTERLAKAIVNL